jgi:hypothetical protein
VICFGVDILQFLGEFESYTFQENPIANNRFYQRTEIGFSFGWNLFADPRYHKG